ncbi:MAG: M24 family metallopeptidase [Armatimonadota bacterium]
MADRLAALRASMDEAKLDALIVTDPLNVGYLSGFAGDSGLLCVATSPAKGSGQYLVTDGRFAAQAPREAPDFELVVTANTYSDAAAEVLRGVRARRVGFEAQHVTFQCFRELKKKIAPAKLAPTKDVVGKLRTVKDSHEIELIRRAARIGDRVYKTIAGRLRPGLKERRVAADIERLLKLQGGQGPAFEAIAASGPNAAFPHAVPGDRRLADRDLVKLDLGVKHGGYCSDLTRTVCLGKPTRKQQRIHNAVRSAQMKAIEGVRPGVKAKKLDRIARRHLEDKGLGKFFVHSLGHGVGRAVHEAPRISKRSDDVLEPGMVFTVEPGVYIEGWGGVRLEDMVLVTEDGCEVLTTAAKPRL